MGITPTIPHHFHNKWFFAFLEVSCINGGVLRLHPILVTCPSNDQDYMVGYASVILSDHLHLSHTQDFHPDHLVIWHH